MAIGSNPIRPSKRKELVAAKATVQNKLQNRSLVYATQLTSQANKSKRAIVDSGANTMLMALDTPLEGGDGEDDDDEDDGGGGEERSS